MIECKGVVSAPGKVIISGEHSAVYGHPVLVMAIDRRLTCEFKSKSGGDQDKFIIIDNNGTKVFDLTEMNGRNEGKLFEYAKSKFTKLTSFTTLEVCIQKTDIPVGAGLGSSASFAACISAAICLSFEHQTSEYAETIRDLIFDCTHFFEKL